jgi:hypothetical protein
MIGTSGPSNIRLHSLASDNTVSSTTAASIAGIAQTLDIGTYIFEYYIIATSATSSVSLKYGINFTGTQTSILYNLFFPSGGVTAATGAVSQALNVDTGNVWAFHNTRTNNTTLGPQASVDSTGAIILYQLTGFIVVTAAGSLQLLHGSETATNTTTKAGTSLLLMKTA